MHIHFLVFPSLACLMLVHSISEALYVCVHREFEIPKLNVEHCLLNDRLWHVRSSSGCIMTSSRLFLRRCEIVGSGPGTYEGCSKIQTKQF